MKAKRKPRREYDCQTCQYRGNTTVRPKKLRAGHYELRGCNGRQYWIISQPLMQDNFLQLMQIAYEEAA